jgi:hypothetical protein
LDEVIARAREILHLPCLEIARSISADESTLHRWRSRTSIPSVVFRVRVGALGDLTSILEEVFPDSGQVRRRLDEPMLCGFLHPLRQVLAAVRPELLINTLLTRGDGAAPLEVS